jgi:hypothetical protein
MIDGFGIANSEDAELVVVFQKHPIWQHYKMVRVKYILC